MNKFGLLFILLVSINCFAQKFDSLALTPPMGWNTYNTFADNYNEQIIRDMADKLVSSGMKDAAYVYIIIYDNWTATRDSLGFLTVDKKKISFGYESNFRLYTFKRTQTGALFGCGI